MFGRSRSFGRRGRTSTEVRPNISHLSNNEQTFFIKLITTKNPYSITSNQCQTSKRPSLANGAQRGEVWSSREGEAFPPRGGVGCGAFSDVGGRTIVRKYVFYVFFKIQKPTNRKRYEAIKLLER